MVGGNCRLLPCLNLPDVFNLLHHANQVSPLFALEAVVGVCVYVCCVFMCLCAVCMIRKHNLHIMHKVHSARLRLMSGIARISYYYTHTMHAWTHTHTITLKPVAFLVSLEQTWEGGKKALVSPLLSQSAGMR